MLYMSCISLHSMRLESPSLHFTSQLELFYTIPSMTISLCNILKPWLACIVWYIDRAAELFLDANGNPNTFSQNLIQAINSRTGGVPIIRFGGTSGYVQTVYLSHPRSFSDLAFDYIWSLTCFK